MLSYLFYYTIVDISPYTRWSTTSTAPTTLMAITTLVNFILYSLHWVTDIYMLWETEYVDVLDAASDINAAKVSKNGTVVANLYLYGWILTASPSTIRWPTREH